MKVDVGVILGVGSRGNVGGDGRGLGGVVKALVGPKGGR